MLFITCASSKPRLGILGRFKRGAVGCFDVAVMTTKYLFSFNL